MPGAEDAELRVCRGPAGLPFGALVLGLLFALAGCCCPAPGSADPPKQKSERSKKSKKKKGRGLDDPKARASIVEDLNNTCADVWCEGAIDFWFHEMTCTRKACTVALTAKIPDYEWLRKHKKLPSAKAKKAMPRKWRVNGKKPVMDVTYDDLPSVLLDGTIELPRKGTFRKEGRGWYLTERGFYKVGDRLDAFEF